MLISFGLQSFPIASFCLNPLQLFAPLQLFTALQFTPLTLTLGMRGRQLQSAIMCRRVVLVTANTVWMRAPAEAGAKSTKRNWRSVREQPRGWAASRLVTQKSTSVARPLAIQKSGEACDHMTVASSGRGSIQPLNSRWAQRVRVGGGGGRRAGVRRGKREKVVVVVVVVKEKEEEEE